MRIRVLQWNVWLREKAHRLLPILQEIDADILCLQEVTTESPYNRDLHLPEYFAKELRMHQTYLVTNRDVWQGGPIVLGNAILSRWPIRSVRHAFIRVPARTREGEMREGRLYLEAEIRLREGSLTVGTAHLSHRFEATADQQAAEMRLLLEEIAHHDARYVLAGDFNRKPASPDVRSIERKLQHCGPPYGEITWSPRTAGLSRVMRDRLDYVFATPDLHVNDAQILAVPASDHKPILVEFDLSNNAHAM